MTIDPARLNMNTVRPELVEGLCFDKLSTNGRVNKPGRVNNVAWEGLFG